MIRNPFPLAAGTLLLAVLAGCSLSSPEKLPPVAEPADGATLTLLQTTDVHHHAAGTGPMSAADIGDTGGYARVAAYVNNVRSNAGTTPVVLVDSGDWSMGTLYDLTDSQQPMATFFLDTLRYDCAALGNHEFDYTPKGLASILAASQSKFGFHTPLVASNTVLNGNTDLAPYWGTAVRSTYTKTLPNGLKVGFFGLMGKEAAAAAPAAAPVTFTDYSAGNYASVQAIVNDLRTTQGCNVVVALSHAGTDVTTGGYTGEDISLAQHVTGIDVIASGHTHNAFADGSAAHAVTNGGWTTQVICAGAYTANVARIDLTWHKTAKNTTVTASSNKAMTDAALVGAGIATPRDGAQTVFVAQADATLNYGMSSLFGQFFPDYSPTDVSKGVYHPVGVTLQDLRSNDQTPVLSPNGLGNLCADSVRNVPNALIQKSLLGAGWNGDPASPTLGTAATALAGLGYDTTPFTLGVVPTGVIRDGLRKNVAISFANLYNVLPLGISPDSTQALPVGYPMMSVYLDYADLKKVCALQLISQTNLTPSDYYLNLSGISYDLDATSSYAYFKAATAAAVLSVTQAKAAAGNTAALKAMQDLGLLGTDHGAALLADMATNPFAAAMVALNDPAATLTPDQIAANLPVLGDVALKAGTDAATGSIQLPTALFNLATAAVSAVNGFAPTDAACTGATTPLATSGRYRVAADLYMVMMMGAAQGKFGVSITAYAKSTGATTVSAANLAAAMAYRINLDGPSATVVELKEWMALLINLITPPAQGGHFTNGTVTGEYLSTDLFTDFLTDGAAVKVRSASYPLATIGQLMTTLATLKAAP